MTLLTYRGSIKITLFFTFPGMQNSTQTVEYPEMKIHEILTAEQLTRLFRPTPQAAIHYHPEKKTKKHPKGVPYVSVSYVTRELNIIFGYQWEHIVTKDLSSEEEVVLDTTLCVNVPGESSSYTLKRHQYGGSKVKRYKSNGKVISLADTYKSAKSDGLKKCASLLGIASDIYGEDEYVEVVDTRADNTSDNFEKEIIRLYDYLGTVSTLEGLQTANNRIYELDHKPLINLFEQKVKQYEQG